MDTLPLALFTIAGAIVGWVILNFFRSPNVSLGEAERRISALEAAYGSLSLKVEGSYARHDEALESLTDAVRRLTDRFERFMERANGNTGK
jgi:hypothetical protein